MVRCISGHVFCPTVLRSSMTHIMSTPLIPHFVYLSHEIALLQKKKPARRKKNAQKGGFCRFEQSSSRRPVWRARLAGRCCARLNGEL